LSELVEEPELRTATSLDRLFCGGEPLRYDVAQRWTETARARLCNLYGPTEACIDATAYEFGDGVDRGVTVPIGPPIWNTQAYVLDGHLQPVPLGVVGELYLGGAGL